MNLKIRKTELIIFLTILVAAILCMVFMRKQKETIDCGSIRITVAGEEFGVFQLGEDQKIAIGDTNTCRIKDGQVKMIEATCPDHLCIKQLPVDQRGGLIICLPNQVVIEGIQSAQAASEQELDGFTG